MIRILWNMGKGFRNKSIRVDVIGIYRLVCKDGFVEEV